MEPAFLAPGRAWEAARTPRQRKRLGQWLTPWWLVEAVLDEVGGPPDSVLDPACGDGRWLVAAGRRWPGARLEGWDVDPSAVDAAREVCAAAGVAVRLRCRDALEGQEQGVAELVVGNPPYVRPQAMPAAQRARVWARYATATDKSDLYAPFIERMLALSGGRVAVVVADTWLSMASFAALRRCVLDAPLDLLAGLPRDSFGAEVGTVAVVFRPEARRRRGHLSSEGLALNGAVRAVDGLLPLEDPVELEGQGTLGERWALRMGVVCGSYAEWVHRGTPGAGDRRTCRGRDVHRWSIVDRGEWVRYDPRAMLDARPYVAPKWAGLFDVPAKVVLAGASGRVLRASVDTERRFPLDSCYVSQGEGDVWALCGLLNSAPVNAWYGARFPAVRVKAVELHRLPWPRGPLVELAEAARGGDQGDVDRAAARAYGLPTGLCADR
ncbi:MAG: methyltransferase [Alphaproteobacteria bacterium]|nr:methyltransferase [Alphaproteobacteria bacterium]